ncbi:MAG: AAA family ATPase [Deltaproteobacteria bacterium]|nr:AAA family ATPase [Deltaproteobacteria bacterium]
MHTIDSLRVRGLGVIDELDLSFKPGFNIIVGANAVGKTSLLRSIIFSVVVDGFNEVRWQPTTSEVSIVIVDANNNKIRVGAGPGTIISSQYRDNKVKSWHPPSRVADDPTEYFICELHLINVSPKTANAAKAKESFQVLKLNRDELIRNRAETTIGISSTWQAINESAIKLENIDGVNNPQSLALDLQEALESMTRLCNPESQYSFFAYSFCHKHTDDWQKVNNLLAKYGLDEVPLP